ncbi:MAG: TldD/PmbA family protein [Planctomycetes bacterium]|jgi:TldD protein|nr:TldD/PmbA family protein [Planctomycetota bacterium]
MDRGFPDEDTMRGALEAALRAGGDFADAFAETVSRSRISLTEGQVKVIHASSDRGTGVRVLAGEATGYSFAESFEEASVLAAAARAAGLAREGSGTRVAPPGPLREKTRTAPASPPSAVPLEAKVALVRRVDEAARAVDPAVVNVQVGYGEIDQEWRLANSEGVRARDGRRIVHVGASATAVRGDARRQGYESVSGPMGFAELEAQAEAIGRAAAEMAVRMLAARPAPAGRMPVVLGNGLDGCGILFHESCGHALESDGVIQGQSVFAGKLGKKVASPLVTLVDDGTLEHLSGGFRFDEEGTPAQRTTLIAGGELVGYLCDLKGARTLRLDPTGNGRRESFRHPPIPRMRCTFLAAGTGKPEALIAGVDRGLYVARIGGGAGEMSGAGFVFSAMEAYAIEGGKLGDPVVGATISGRGVDLLEGVDGVGDDFAMSRGGGMCGKQGQMVHVNEGQPTVLLRGLTVGGGRP